MRRTICKATVLLILVLLSACGGGERSKTQSDEPNVIKEYVNTPKDRARSAGSALEDAQEKTRKQAADLMED